MKKLLLSVLLLFVVCNVGYSAENLYARFSTSKKIELQSGHRLYILKDIKTNTEYIVLENFQVNGTGAILTITPLIKPAVYVHKK